MNRQAINDLNPKIVLGVAAHPDDLDFGAAGTIAAWTQAGTTVHYLILTDGSKGSADRNMTPSKLIEIRRNEQRAAGDVLGVKDIFFLGYVDGLLENTMELKRDVTRYIRQVKPDVVVTMDPSVLYAPAFGFVNHPDHRAAGNAVLDAVFPLARDHMSFPELLADGYEPHKTSTLMLINLKEANMVVDITGTIELKMQALAAHASQMPDLQATQNQMRAIAEQMGKAQGYTYAEQFMRIDII